MKSTGIVRNIDSLGRIVLPIELRPPRPAPPPAPPRPPNHDAS